MSFSDIFSSYDYDEIAREISGEQAFRFGIPAAGGDAERTARGPSAFGTKDVRRALDAPAGRRDPADLKALLSTAARPFLAEMKAKARELSRQTFGNVVELAAPIYLSNTCKTVCTYCAFSRTNEIKRKTLTVEEAEREARLLRGNGIGRVVLLTGEDYVATPVSYLAEVSRRLSRMFSSVHMEIYPLEEDDYARLLRSRTAGVIIYQETYDQKRYAEVHKRGMKRKFHYRLDGLDRAGRAGIRGLTVGALLGLSDPAADVFMVGMHADYLARTYRDVQLVVSLPRLRPAVGFEDVPILPDDLYVQFFCALRLFLPGVRFALSTREPPEFRAELVPICINLVGAGSNVAPGGYSGEDTTAQFSIGDHSSVADVAQMLKGHDLMIQQ